MKEQLTFRDRVRALRPGQIIWPLIIILVLIGAVIGVSNYLNQVDETKVPTVEVDESAQNTTVTDSEFTLTGKTEKGNTVTINDQKVEVDEDGNFSADLKLAAGANTITITATGKNGKSSVQTTTITRQVPKPMNTSTSGNGAVAGSLSSSGPESFWIPEAAFVSAVAVGWYMTRKQLTRAQRKI